MDQGREFEQRFKAAVEKNFDQSAGHIRPFRGAAHLFETLTRPPARADRTVEAGENPRCRVRNRDLDARPQSSSCLEVAEHLRDRHQRTDAPAGEGTVQVLAGGLFHPGRRGKPFDVFNESFDAIFYAASIFLLPGFAESLRQASNLLVPAGCCRSVTTQACSTKRGTTRSRRCSQTRNTSTARSRSRNSLRASNRCPGRGQRGSISVSRPAGISCSTSCRSQRNLQDFFRRSLTSSGSESP